MVGMKLVMQAIAVVVAAQTVQACMWDRDTLAMEKRTFPEAPDLIAGKFLRHSPNYYKWRIQDRLALIQTTPRRLALYDDLAVAYDKTGQSDKAIETMLKKESIQSGLYETEANLGTFYIHSGQFEKGVLHIDRAIKINPDAHFGREIYQKLLVEYVLSKQIDGAYALPLSSNERMMGGRGFADYVLTTEKIDAHSKPGKDELEKALKGILGMMRFGHHDHPVLLEALGDILISKGGAKRLASRAYLKASYSVSDTKVKQAYREKASNALSMQTRHRATYDQLTLDELEASFMKELKQAEVWYQKIVAKEAAWMKAGKNLDDAFTGEYYERSEE
jgi:tetratricopeptide (TPR) repeat protein